jgi:hypothetical protein
MAGMRMPIGKSQLSGFRKRKTGDSMGLSTDKTIIKERIQLNLNRPYYIRSNSAAHSSKIFREDLIVPLSKYHPQRDAITILFHRLLYRIIILASTSDLYVREMDADTEREEGEDLCYKPIPIKQFPLYLNYPHVHPCFDKILKGDRTISYVRMKTVSFIKPPGEFEHISCTIEDFPLFIGWPAISPTFEAMLKRFLETRDGQH